MDARFATSMVAPLVRSLRSQEARLGTVAVMSAEHVWDPSLPQSLVDYLAELDEFIEREIKPIEQRDDNMRFFDHRREDARTDWDRGGLPNDEWEALLHEVKRVADLSRRVRVPIVVAEITSYGDNKLNPVGRIVRVLGAASDPGVDVLSIVYEHRLPLEFPAEVITEAERSAERPIQVDVTWSPG